jgi:acyl dehydratase
MSALELATRRFVAADQAAFAELSGDFNPIHLDPLAARRTQAGWPVVHGVHAALWALEALAAEGIALDRLAGIRVQFHKFIYLDCDVALRVSRRDAEGLGAELLVNGVVVTALSLTFGAWETATGEFAGLPETSLGPTPLAPPISEADGLAGWLRPSTTPASTLFPILCGAFDDARVAAVAQLSAVVGMACPGLHSIFSSFAVNLVDNDNPQPGLGWRASLPDPRYARIGLTLGGSGIRGEAKALMRAAPVESPGLDILSTLVTQDEFAGRTALIVGGSRGLGAVTAKLLAAGGAKVIVTYAAGEADARRVVEDVRATRGEASARMARCDVMSDLAAQLTNWLPGVTHLYYFPTSRISRQEAGLFSPATFAEFTKIYVERFHDLCLLALGVAGRSDLTVFYPSTVYVGERPRGTTEYAMAKSAGEVLCADLAQAFPGLSITAPRLPRVLTDQTASALPVKTEDPVAVMLPLLRAERPA